MDFSSLARRSAAAAALVLSLASCGGESLVAFNPARILVFGDQSSVITAEPVPATGRKYTINALETDENGNAKTDENGDPIVNCVANPLWIQILASAYGMGFPECPNPTEAVAPTSRILAKPGALAGGTGPIDLTAQVTRQLELPAADGGGINSQDLVSVFAGVNDVVAAFEFYKGGGNYDVAVARAEQAGSTIAAQVNRIAAAGGRVIVSTTPDVGVTPYARALDAADAALLTFLTARVNARLLVEVNNNGRLIGLIELNPYLIAVVTNPAAYGYADVRQAACIPLDPSECTTQTLQTGAASYTWLWASALQLSPGGHLQLGNLAASRAKNQPF